MVVVVVEGVVVVVGTGVVVAAEASSSADTASGVAGASCSSGLLVTTDTEMDAGRSKEPKVLGLGLAGTVASASSCASTVLAASTRVCCRMA